VTLIRRVVRCAGATCRACSSDCTCWVTEEGESRSRRAVEEKLWVSTTATKKRIDGMLASLRIMFCQTAAGFRLPPFQK
jgi:hypothetical protein